MVEEQVGQLLIVSFGSLRHQKWNVIVRQLLKTGLLEYGDSFQETDIGRMLMHIFRLEVCFMPN